MTFGAALPAVGSVSQFENVHCLLFIAAEELIILLIEIPFPDSVSFQREWADDDPQTPNWMQ